MTEPIDVEAYVSELVTLLNMHISRNPDPGQLEAVWRVGFATLLAEIVRGKQLLAADSEAFLDRVCASLRTVTRELIERGDASGWRLP